MMKLSVFKSFMDGAKNAYLHAVEKHPKFVDNITTLKLNGVRRFLKSRRYINDAKVAISLTPTFEEIVDEELLEYYEATLLGDKEQAKRELFDCVAVLMREWERISDEEAKQ